MATELTLDEALTRAANRLEDAYQVEKRQVAHLLAEHVFNCTRAQLIARMNDRLSAAHEEMFFDCVERALHMPVYRVIGEREFHGLSLTLNTDTLEPRDDTETLIDAVLNALSGRKSEALRFADLGAGTGAIALALLSELPNSKCVASDIAPGALDAVCENAKRCGLSARVETVVGSWLEPLSGKFDFICSNPPYIASHVVDELSPMVRDHDPRCALDGGADGLDAYRTIFAEAAHILEPGGFLAVEIGFDQAGAITELGQVNGWQVDPVVCDLGGRDRVLVLRPQ